MLYFGGKLVTYLHEMSLQDPAVTKGIAVVEHLLEMLAAEAFFISDFPDITFHIGSAGA